MLLLKGGAKARPYKEPIWSRGSGLPEATANEWAEAEQAGAEQEQGGWLRGDSCNTWTACKTRLFLVHLEASGITAI
jgi:hypothetical protein